MEVAEEREKEERQIEERFGRKRKVIHKKTETGKKSGGGKREIEEGGKGERHTYFKSLVASNNYLSA